MADIDDLLPPTPAMFDLVILDEASAVDQPLAAAALLRGRRAVVAGDPRQLRQVSFVSDDRLREVLVARGLDDAPTLAARLDVRRNSVLDVAAAVSSALLLDEHFRSDPHLFDFVAERLYGGTVSLSTRTPRTQGIDCIDVTRVDGSRDASGVVGAEARWVTGRLHELRRRGARSVGVVTPFRAQADAIEQAVLAAFDADALEAMDLRVGTAHAFQGNERDVVLVSLGIGPAEGPASWRFVEDPHLFAVLVTRARRRLELVLSADAPAGGLVAGYLAQADAPPGAPSSARTLGPWAEQVAADLEGAGVGLIRAYPTGRHVVDVCIDDSTRALALECDVHPDGPEAHVERHLALLRAGWDVRSMHRSRWEERSGELLVGLVDLIGSAPPSPDG